jgi:PAS domain S-box-containing protein
MSAARPPEGTPARTQRVRVWTLRQHLSALLLLTMALTFALVSVIVVWWRVPQIEHDSLQGLNQDVTDVAQRLELLLGARRARLELMAGLLREHPPEQAATLLAWHVQSDDPFRAVYRLSPQRRVDAVGLAPDLGLSGDDFVGTDLSDLRLVQATRAAPGTRWDGHMLSVLSGDPVVGVAYRGVDDQLLVGEVSLAQVLRELRAVGPEQAAMLWVVDRSGEVIADTDGRHMRRLNVYNWPLFQAAWRGDTATGSYDFEQQRWMGALAHAPSLGWVVMGSIARGWQHPDVQQVAHYALGGLAGCLVLGLLIAPAWARWMARPLKQIADRTAQGLAGHARIGEWPRGPVTEINGLARDLEAMAASLQERERKLQTLFAVAPVPMALVDFDDGVYLDVNQVWAETMGYSRAEAVGLSGQELGLWKSQEQYAQLLAGLQDDTLSGEIEIVTKTGEVKLLQALGRVLRMPGQNLAVWGSVHVGPLRRIEHELRALNQDLEARVEQGTAAQAATHDELSQNLSRLQATQAQLVRSEKMAALGGLVAGVAHELNTPLGNGVLALSAVDDATKRFRTAMQDGLRRADLLPWVEGVEQGVDIAARNLRRAAALVQSFKQVAVDQTSAQRRRFELYEVVHEMVVSLRPSFARTPYQIEVDVPAQGLRLDSYPGALGQALGNLIQNAVRHGLDGRAHGTVRITAGHDAEAPEAGQVWLRVSDDGHGIEPALLDRIFDPFMTTRMGRGGTGLGLHISYNAVVQLLGGSLTVHSVLGQGACFEMRLPLQAPRATGAAP